VILYTCDPSTKATGLALFHDRRLVSVQLFEAKGVHGMLEQIARLTVPREAELLIEAPGFYRFDRAKPENVAKIHQIVGAVRAHFTTSRTVTPVQWNRGVPKNIAHPRIKALLSRVELAMVESIREAVRHNVYDAVGLGLWLHGRTV
jgi:hypothetical protein